MSKLIFITIPVFIISSCSKQEVCFCNEGNGDYEYLPPSTNAQSSGIVNSSGELDEECELQNNYLKAINSTSYCKLD